MHKTGKRSNRSEGDRGEAFAVQYLVTRGWTIIHRPYRCRSGEVDVIAMDGDTLVFVEVKLRKSACYGDPILAVNRNKQKRVIKTARHYLAYGNPPDYTWCRFDVIGLIQRSTRSEYDIRHVTDAFRLEPDDMAFSC